jgi:valyl-tRNA synthetase
MVRDEQRKKLSKSLGNSPDPLELIEQYGADALRIGLLFITPEGQDVLFSTSRIEVGRNFVNKIWNASRFILSTIENENISVDDTLVKPTTKEGKWILSRIQYLTAEITTMLSHYRFNDAAKTLYEFFWHEFCDWYLELIKPLINQKDQETTKNICSVTVLTLKTLLKLLHPFIPFITEDLYQRLPHKDKSISISSWPKQEKGFTEKNIEKEFILLKEVINALRNIRGEMGISPKRRAPVIITSTQSTNLDWISPYEIYIKELGKVETLTTGANIQKPPFSASWVVGEMEIYVPLKDLIDIKVEKERLLKEIQKLEKEIFSLDKKLSNEKFLQKAQTEVVEYTTEKQAEFISKIEKLRKILTTIIEENKGE